MITSKTYNGLSGTNYIQKPELAFAILYVVKRGGIQYDKYISGSSNRTYIHEVFSGKIFFDVPFDTPTPETVFVMFKSPSVFPECSAVSIPVQSLKNGIVGRSYSSSLLIFGTSPKTLNVLEKPTWATINFTLDKILKVTGIPDAVGEFDFQFEFDNCGGPQIFDYTINVYESTSNLSVSTTGFQQRITDITGITYTIISGSFPVRQGTFPPTMDAVFDDYTGVINVSVSGITFPKTLYLYKNAVEQEAIPVPSNGTYTFASASYLSTDNLQIIL